MSSKNFTRGSPSLWGHGKTSTHMPWSCLVVGRFPEAMQTDYDELFFFCANQSSKEDPPTSHMVPAQHFFVYNLWCKYWLIDFSDVPPTVKHSLSEYCQFFLSK